MKFSIDPTGHWDQALREERQCLQNQSTVWPILIVPDTYKTSTTVTVKHSTATKSVMFISKQGCQNKVPKLKLSSYLSHKGAKRFPVGDFPKSCHKYRTQLHHDSWSFPQKSNYERLLNLLPSSPHTLTLIIPYIPACIKLQKCQKEGNSNPGNRNTTLSRKPLIL